MSETYFYILAIVVGVFLSTNPFSIHLFSKLLIAHKAKGTLKHKASLYGFLYLFLVWLWLSIIAVILYASFLSLSTKNLEYVSIAVAILGIIAGFIELKKYNWPKAHSEKKTMRLHKLLLKEMDLPAVVKLSLETIFANIASYIVPVLIFSVLVCFLSSPHISFLFIFTIALILSLIKVYLLNLMNVKMTAVLEWNQNSKSIFRLCIGAALVMLSWLLLLVISKVVRLN